MFELQFEKATTLKKIIDAIKDLVKSCNIDISSSGLNLETMDVSHVTYIKVHLPIGMFEKFTCTRKHILGVNLTALSKILQCADNNDVLIMKVQDDDDDSDILFSFKSPVEDEEKKKKKKKEKPDFKRVSEISLKQMSIEMEHLSITGQEYNAEVTMP